MTFEGIFLNWFPLRNSTSDEESEDYQYLRYGY